MNSDALEKIYNGSITKWSEILGEEFGGNSLTGVGCTPASDKITPVVRNDGSGTTHIFKRYLALINPSRRNSKRKTPARTAGANWPKARRAKSPANR